MITPSVLNTVFTDTAYEFRALARYSHDHSKQAPASQNYRHQALKRPQPASAINQSPLKVLTL